MKNWKWWAFLLVGTSLCLCAPTAFAAESAGLHTQLPGAELWQPYLDQSPVDALQAAEDPWSVLQSFCTSSLFQTLRESIRGYAALLLFLLLSAIVSLFLGEEGDHSWCDLVCAGGCGILLWEPLLEIARQLCAQIESWNRFLSGFLPVYAGVLIMGGETSAGAAASGFFSDIALSAGTGPDGLCTAHSGMLPCNEHGLLYHGTELPGEPVQSGRDTAAKGTFPYWKAAGCTAGIPAHLCRTARPDGASHRTVSHRHHSHCGAEFERCFRGCSGRHPIAQKRPWNGRYPDFIG